MAEGLQELFREMRRARTPEEIARAEANAAAHVREHSEDEMPVLQAGEMLAMKRESVELFGVANTA